MYAYSKTVMVNDSTVSTEPTLNAMLLIYSVLPSQSKRKKFRSICLEDRINDGYNIDRNVLNFSIAGPC